MTENRGGKRDGAGRPKMNVDVRKIALYPSQWKWLNENAKLHSTTRNDLARNIVDLHIQNIESGK